MRKMIIIVLALAMVLSFAVVAYGTQGVANGRQLGYTSRVCQEFIDEDGDGICDNGRFIDENGDGICDNCPNGGVPLRNGMGRQYGRQAK